ncbi:hypothetical protein QO003_003607 [Arthrobacter silviterrae]|nr:hypothetical protein [Arthrobacter silviterrae]
MNFRRKDRFDEGTQLWKYVGIGVLAAAVIVVALLVFMH